MSSRLYKLKYFCQLCQKQLKDDNGYRCHLQSESHKQMMGTYMTNPEKIMNTFSKEFENAFIDTLNSRHPHTAVAANTVYQEMIKDQFHVHMSGTRWSTLSDFVKYLEKAEICEVNWNEGKPIIKFIDKNAKEVVKETEQEKRMRKREMENRRAEREFRRLGELAKREQKKVEKVVESEKKEVETTEKAQKETTSEGKISFNLNINLAKVQGGKNEGEKEVKNVFKQVGLQGQNEKKREVKEAFKPKSNLDMLLTMVNKGSASASQHKASNENKRQKTEENKEESKDEPWLCKGIFVKITQKTLGGGKFYKQIGKVYKITSPSDKFPDFAYHGNVKMTSGSVKGTKISIDQANLEPVIPSIEEGKVPKVMVIKDSKLYKGKIADLVSIDSETQTGVLKLTQDEMLKIPIGCFSECKVKD